MTSYTQSDFTRLEEKVDRLTDAVTQLVLFEERQLQQGKRLDVVETRLNAHELALRALDTRVNTWVQRGVGAWAVAATGWALFQGFAK